MFHNIKKINNRFCHKVIKRVSIMLLRAGRTTAINSDIKNKDRKDLRENYITNKSEKFKENSLKWVRGTPHDSRDAAKMGLLKNYKCKFALKRRNFKLYQGSGGEIGAIIRFAKILNQAK